MSSHFAGPHLQIRPANLYIQRPVFRWYSIQALPNFFKPYLVSFYENIIDELTSPTCHLKPNNQTA
jgi:hypothetical protein